MGQCQGGFKCRFKVRVCKNYDIYLPSVGGSQATVACRSLGIINSTYSAITGPRTSHHQTSHVHHNSVSVQREYSFPHFLKVVPLELLLQLLSTQVAKGEITDSATIIPLLFSSYYPTRSQTLLYLSILPTERDDEEEVRRLLLFSVLYRNT